MVPYQLMSRNAAIYQIIANLCAASGESLVISHLSTDFAQPCKPQRTNGITTLVTWLVTPPVPAMLKQQESQEASNINMTAVVHAHPALHIETTKVVN